MKISQFGTAFLLLVLTHSTTPTPTSPLILYEFLPSPAVRATKLCLNELGLRAEYVTIDITKGEQMKEEFVKKNPQHTVPTLEIGDLIMWDSHAINAFLVSSYATTDGLYSTDPKVRAHIDQRLHFDTGVLFPALKTIGMKLVYTNGTLAQEDLEKVTEALDFVDKFLEGGKFITGDAFNIADFSVYTTTTTLDVIAKARKLPEHPRVDKYLADCKAAFKGAAEDEHGFQAFKDLYEPKLK